MSRPLEGPIVAPSMLSADFSHYTVSTAVNNSRSEGAQLVEAQRSSHAG